MSPLLGYDKGTCISLCTENVNFYKVILNDLKRLQYLALVSEQKSIDIKFVRQTINDDKKLAFLFWISNLVNFLCLLLTQYLLIKSDENCYDTRVGARASKNHSISNGSFTLKIFCVRKKT